MIISDFKAYFNLEMDSKMDAFPGFKYTFSGPENGKYNNKNCLRLIKFPSGVQIVYRLGGKLTIIKQLK